MKIKIRKFTHKDLQAVLELSQLAFTPIYESFEQILGPSLFKLVYPNWVQSNHRYIRSICETNDKENFYIAEENGIIVGFISFFENDKKKSGEIGINAVHPNCQKRGIGKKMYEYVLQIMKESGLKFVEVSTGGDPAHLGARNAYEKCGFAPLPLVKFYKAL